MNEALSSTVTSGENCIVDEKDISGQDDMKEIDGLAKRGDGPKDR